MKLKTVAIQRYRSFVRQATLQLSERTTTILGPNNEGKSNLLKAIVLAMNCLSAVRSPHAYETERKGNKQVSSATGSL
ncbi:MAG: AAA family ATPase [Ignavibacteria bacterium]|nr:AAA family ATPase [Ignavibacteria bacterium]